MRIVAISDSHTQKVHNLPDGDVLIHSGDWSSRGTLRELTAFCAQLEEWVKKYPKVVVIAGNHDFIAEALPALTKETIESTGAMYLQDSGCEIQDPQTGEVFKFWGSPVQPWFCDWAFNRERGGDIQRHWDLIPEDTEVLITHGPPMGVGDTLSAYGSEPGENVGCANLLSTILGKLKALRLHTFGHIHEGSGVYQKYGIIFVNASILDEHYRQVFEPKLVEIHKDKK